MIEPRGALVVGQLVTQAADPCDSIAEFPCNSPGDQAKPAFACGAMLVHPPVVRPNGIDLIHYDGITGDHVRTDPFFDLKIVQWM